MVRTNKRSIEPRYRVFFRQVNTAFGALYKFAFKRLPLCRGRLPPTAIKHDGRPQQHDNKQRSAHFLHPQSMFQAPAGVHSGAAIRYSAAAVARLARVDNAHSYRRQGRYIRHYLTLEQAARLRRAWGWS